MAKKLFDLDKLDTGHYAIVPPNQPKSGTPALKVIKDCNPLSHDGHGWNVYKWDWRKQEYIKQSRVNQKTRKAALELWYHGLTVHQKFLYGLEVR